MIAQRAPIHTLWMVMGIAFLGVAVIYVIFGGPADTVDRVSYGAGCRDAVYTTSLEPSADEVSASLLDHFGPPSSAVCFDLPPK